MKTISIILIIFLEANLVFAQTLTILTNQHIQPSRVQSNKNFVEYQIGRIQLYNGKGKESKYFYITDKSTEHKVYEYKQEKSKALRFVPQFFKAEGNDNLVILCMSLEGNYSWGNHIFIIDRGEVFHAGFIEYGADNFNFSSIAIYSSFEKHDDWFKMIFRDDMKFINYNTDNLIGGNYINFKIEKNEITRIK